MTKNSIKILLIFMMIFLASCAQKPNEIYIISKDKKIPVIVEIADDSEERAKGLMFRQSLDGNSGMLFVFESENHHGFWMKNTQIPLDMIFISKDGKIVDIKYAVPCESDPCPSYKPKEKAKYVLEVNGDYTSKNDINIDDRVDFGGLI